MTYLVNPAEPLILVADDDPDASHLFERYLIHDGLRVALAKDGSEVLELARKTSPDLVLLDVDMPAMDGYDACAELQRTPETSLIPVVFVTGRGAPQDKAHAFAVGAADYLVKPVTREMLLETVHRHLETRSRWYQAATAAELWDGAPLPKKFAQFRSDLIKTLGVKPEVEEKLCEIPSTDVYLFTKHLDISYEELAQAMAAFFGIGYMPCVQPESIQLGILPTAFCKKNYVVAIKDNDGGDAVVIVNPFSWGLAELDVIGNAFRNRPYRLVMTHRGGMRSLFVDSAESTVELIPEAAQKREIGGPEQLALDSLLTGEGGASAIEIVNALVTDAVRRRASDLHIQPGGEHIHVRYRIDGRLQELMPLPRTRLPSIVARIKILCGMDMTESRAPQDGNCKLRVDGREVELRASTLPTTHGEKVVLRILSSTADRYQLDGLGFPADLLSDFRGVLAARQGMVLITGPTGSGKTTTLYSALNYIHRPELNVVTVEDPVELDVAGISQVQVHDKAGRGFATTLRAMLRQDPDIIMVGEIRDTETAEIACRAAMTGHLVLSTLHTPSALSALPRLLDMGVPAYLAASSLIAVVAQRLVLRVCEECAYPYDPPPPLRAALQKTFGSLNGARFRKGRGCARCHRSGNLGRIGVYEMLTLDDDLRHLMTTGASPSELRAYVMRGGFHSLEQDAFEKAAAGLVAPEEISALGFDLARAVARDSRPLLRCAVPA